MAASLLVSVLSAGCGGGSGDPAPTAVLSDALNAPSATADGSPPPATGTTGLPTTAATIVSVTDDLPPSTGLVIDSASTNDPTPTLRGALSGPLAGGESVVVLRNGVVAGIATVEGATWTFTDSLPVDGPHRYAAAIRNGGGGLGPASATFAITVAPTVYRITDLGVVPGCDATCETYATTLSPSGRLLGQASRPPAWSPFTTTATWSDDRGWTLLPFPYGRDASDSGSVVGGGNIRSEPSQAFVWRAETGQVALGFLPSTDDSVAVAVNEAGDVAGTSGVWPNGLHRAFRWRASTGLVALPVPATDDSSYAGDIDGAGGIVGWRVPAGGAARAYLWQADGTGREIGVLEGDRESYAMSVNSAGVVAGTSSRADASRAFVWQAERGATALPGLPGAGRCSAHRVDDRGVVFGECAPDDLLQRRPTLWIANRAIDVATRIDPDDPLRATWRIVDVGGQDDRGQIAATALAPNASGQGVPRAVLLVPR